MKTFLKKILIISLAFVLIVISPITTMATTADNGKELPDLVNYIDQFNWPEGPELSSEGAYVIEANSGAVLWRKNSNEQFYPASITKVLTGLIVVENISDLSEKLTFSYNAVNDLESGGYSYVAKEGDELSVEDALYAMLLSSSNEAAIALAEHVAGSVEAFAEMMNQKAEELGCTNSNFCNPNGLTNENHKTTPHDMALIMRAAVNNEKFLEIDSTLQHTTAPTTSNPNGFICSMSHKMMWNYETYYDERVVCGKTGYLSTAKNTLLTYASDGEMDIIVCVMCADGGSLALEDTEALIDYAFDNFKTTAITNSIDKTLLQQEIEAKTAREVENVAYDDSFILTLPKTINNVDVAWSLDLASDADEGTLNYYLIETPLDSRPITISYKPTVAEEIEDVITTEDGSVNWILIVTMITGVLALVLLVIIVIMKIKNHKLKKSKGENSGGRSRRKDGQHQDEITDNSETENTEE